MNSFCTKEILHTWSCSTELAWETQSHSVLGPWKGPSEPSGRPLYFTNEIHVGHLPTACQLHRGWVAQLREEPRLPDTSFLCSPQCWLPSAFNFVCSWAFWHLLGLHSLLSRKSPIFFSVWMIEEEPEHCVTEILDGRTWNKIDFNSVSLFS